MVSVELDDGNLAVPEDMVEALREELAAVGRLTVAGAQVLVEKWRGTVAGTWKP